jgi:hypothetical protein
MHSQFNKMATEFLSKMAVAFPDEHKIIVYRQQFDILRMMNQKKPVEMFMENLMPFGEQILTKNEIFFKQDEFVDAVENISGKMGLIAHWDTMSEGTRNSIWEYMQGLYILGMASLGNQKELQEMIKITGFKG